MRTVFRILLAPVWLLLAILKLAFRLAAGVDAQCGAQAEDADIDRRKGVPPPAPRRRGLR
jgi:hypothetical protein